MKLELSLHASGLKNVAGLGKGTSDPFSVVTRLSTRQGTAPEVLGKTEVIKNTLRPEWTKVFVFDYELGTPMKLAVTIFDEVRKGENKSMGSAIFDVGELLGARGCTKAKRIKSGGTLFAHVRKSAGSGLLRLKMKGLQLKNTEGFMRKSDPYFTLSRRVDVAGGQTWDKVYRSQPEQNTLNPAWGDAVVELSILCGGDLDLPIKVNVYDHESSGKHVSMGSFETSVNGLLQADTGGSEDMGKAIPLQTKGKEVGRVVILKANVSGIQDVSERMTATSISAPAPTVAATSPPEPPSFVDYVSGGCQLNVVVAIDFTGSNGDPRKPGTLHYLDPNGSYNDYQKAISAIVGLLAKYDSDQKFPVLGFGAKYDGVVRHCFQCGSKAEAHGVQGVLDAYREVFRSGLIMSKPTVFNDAIETAATRAKNSQEAARQKGQQAYTILLIVTDGAVSDPNATAACLNRVSDSPLSVVIVGVGNADFGAMQFLDDANSSGRRDIAQFVEFNKHCSNSVDLTSATLREIPQQLVGYYQSKGIQALPPVETREEEIVVEDEEQEIDLTLDFDEEEIVVTGGGDDFVDGFAPKR